MKLKEVISHFGGLTAAARALGVTRQSLYIWRQRGSIPFQRQCQIQIVTGGALQARK